jgi:hypothetical protein
VDSLTGSIDRASYEVTLNPYLHDLVAQGMSYAELAARAESRVRALLEATEVFLPKRPGDDTARWNARPSIVRLSVLPDGPPLALSMTLSLTGGSLRPERLAAEVLDWARVDPRLFPVRRTELAVTGLVKPHSPLDILEETFRWWEELPATQRASQRGKHASRDHHQRGSR